MKKSNLWAPWACALIAVGCAITANTPYFAAMKGHGEVTLYIIMAVFIILVPVTYNMGKNNK